MTSKLVIGGPIGLNQRDSHSASLRLLSLCFPLPTVQAPTSISYPRAPSHPDLHLNYPLTERSPFSASREPLRTCAHLQSSKSHWKSSWPLCACTTILRYAYNMYHTRIFLNCHMRVRTSVTGHRPSFSTQSCAHR